MRMACAVVLAGLTCAVLVADDGQPAPKPSTYTDRVYGFSMQTPTFPKATKGVSVRPVVLCGPEEGGFASNANVMVQSITTTREAYLTQSLNQIKAMRWKVNSMEKTTVSGRDALRFDYEGKMGARDLRWLAVAIVDTERVFLVTCTTTKDGFKKYGKAFDACLRSFALETK